MTASRPGRRVLLGIYSHNTWGGIEQWLAGLCRSLREGGWDVWLGLARGSRYNNPDAFRQTHPGLPTVEFDGRTGTTEGRIRAVTRILHQLRPDVFLPVGLADAFLAANRLKRAGVPLRTLAAVRATSPEILGEMERLAPGLDLCIGNNPLHTRFLASRGAYPDERLRTIINGVALPANDWIRSARPSTTLRVLYVGRFHQEHKRTLDLVTLAEELERRGVDYVLTIVGDGDRAASLKGSLERHLAAGRVRFLGYLPVEQIRRDIYPVQDVLIHLSPSEGCPQAVQQAMAHGVVPVCSEFLGAHSLGFLRDGKTCLFFPIGDMAAAAERLEALQQQPEELQEMSQAARASMVQHGKQDADQHWSAAITDVLDMPVRIPSVAEVNGLESCVPRSRLERLGLPRGAADGLRRLLRRFPTFPDGWAEWPGTSIALDAPTRAALLTELQRLDQAARPVKEFVHVHP